MTATKNSDIYKNMTALDLEVLDKNKIIPNEHVRRTNEDWGRNE